MTDHSSRLDETDLWIPGQPATFATRGEAPWKESIRAALSPIPPGDKPIGLILEFSVDTLTPGGMPRDLDNLCEPVFSTVVNKLKWFGGSRPNIRWWSASVEVAAPPGLRLRASAAGFPASGVPPAFSHTFAGPLPKSGTDPGLPGSLANQGVVLGGRALEVELCFGSSSLNIGDIATGRVKNVIDCLYLVLGGTAGSPNDHRIRRLRVAMGIDGAPAGGVVIRIWGIGD